MRLEFPENLPINQRREEIAELIKTHSVIVVAGETGSGKTTQLPKICIALGLHKNGLIGHTQPRRIAARSVANRIAEELKVPLGHEVGFQVRFNDQSTKDTILKLMTDGVLLAELQHDRLLKKYGVIIIDEAHERSLNIDFLLGLLKPICRKRPELKIIITSATIDLEKFSRHFEINGQKAPIIEVSGRTYPVETIYAPIENDSEPLPQTISNQVAHIARAEAKGDYKASGDILVFCAGEREIREAAQAIRRDQLAVDVLPLYSRLSVQEQNKVFKPSSRRKVVLATNVAETSITVPGIAYVIDPGLARISRYSFRSKIQRLPIEPISQASANQRLGRCGRVSNGVCIRLYSEQDFKQRPEFTQAEILRSNLASVILKMLRLGIRKIDKFDFIDRPDSRLLNDGFKLLEELQAVEKTCASRTQKSQYQLTKVGRQVSDLPIDPRFAKILVSANELGCLRDALVVVSVLSIQDPRERPTEHQQAADQKHALLKHKQSDFFSFLFLWQAIENERQALSNAQFKKLCVTQFWSIARIFEWRELVRQLGKICKSQGWSIGTWSALELPKANVKTPKSTSFDERYSLLHRALVSGLLSNIANKDLDGEYLATRNRRIHLFPSSSLAKLKPKWLIASEYLETSRVFAINAASIDPEWVLEYAQHLVKFSHSAPRYHVRSGSVKAVRKTLFQGLVLKDKEMVAYGNINPEESRQVFIAEALVGEKYQPRANNAPFVNHNKALREDIEKAEAKMRRRNLSVSDEQLIRFYNDRLPDSVISRSRLEKWLTQGNQERLKLDRKKLLNTQLIGSELAQFPNQIEVHGKSVRLHYRFNPNQLGDGVTMHVPISILAPFPAHIGDWLVPGLLREKCVALIKSLPKQTRKHYAPAGDTIDRIFDRLLEVAGTNTSITQVLADALYRTKGVKVTETDFDTDKLDAYYLMNYRVIDVDGSLVEESRDLVALKTAYSDAVKASVHADNTAERIKLEKHNINAWDFGALPDQVQFQHQGMTVHAFMMLSVRQDDSVSLMVSDNQDIATYESQRAILRLARTVLSSTTQKQTEKYLTKELFKPSAKPTSAPKKSGLSQLAVKLETSSAIGRDHSNWTEEVISASLASVCFNNRMSDIKDKKAFEEGLLGAKQWVPLALKYEAALLSALKMRNKLEVFLRNNPASNVAVDLIHEDVKSQLDRLFEPTFLRYTSLAQLQQYPRYLKAIEVRLVKARLKPQPIQNEQELVEFQSKADELVQKLKRTQDNEDFAYHSHPKLRDFQILLEEWRVSIYAQHLKTQQPASLKRAHKFWSVNVENT